MAAGSRWRCSRSIPRARRGGHPRGPVGASRLCTGRSAAPSPDHEEASSPLGHPPHVAHQGTNFAFALRQDDGSPGHVRPVPADPLRDENGGPAPRGQCLVQAAFQRLSAVTGLRFVDDGPTDEQPSQQRQAFQPGRYGDRWVPVLIAWQSAPKSDFAADVAGEAGSQSLGVRGKPTVYVTGQVMLDAEKLAVMMRSRRGGPVARAIVLHELGHLVGLAHVSEPSQIMYPKADENVLDYASGDLTGLARLGAGPWLPGSEGGPAAKVLDISCTPAGVRAGEPC